MSDSREQLGDLIHRMRSVNYSVDDVAESILERFEVTPKLAVTPNDLGAMAKIAVLDYRGRSQSDCDAGFRLLEAMNEAGLKIVRVDE